MDIDTLYLVDGEHQPDTVLRAVELLSRERGWRALGMYFLGGREKLRDLEELSLAGVELVVPENPMEELTAVLERLRPQLVVDLSDTPVMTSRLRMEAASRVLAAGAVYRGADFEFRPPRRERIFRKPSCTVLGTGKRCGKTAVSSELAVHLQRRGVKAAVLAMGRGGPPQPQLLVDEELTPDFLLGEAEKGKHAASDHYEDFLVTGVPTVGCRRCGGGMAGEAFVSNCVQGARLIQSLPVDGIIVEGSGACVPPVETHACICVTSAGGNLEESLGFLGPYRLLISDGVIITMAEEPFASPCELDELEKRIKLVKGKVAVVRTIFRPHPLKSIRGRRVFLACTAPEKAGDTMAAYLEEREGCRVVGRSHNLADRRALRRDLEEAGEAEVFLTELKAAAVDTVTRYARETGREVVYFHNRLLVRDGEGRLEEFFDFVWRLAEERACP